MNRSTIKLGAIILVISGIIFLIGTGLSYSGRSENIDAIKKFNNDEIENLKEFNEDSNNAYRLENTGNLIGDIGIFLMMFGLAAGIFGIAEKEKFDNKIEPKLSDRDIEERINLLDEGYEKGLMDKDSYHKTKNKYLKMRNNLKK